MNDECPTFIFRSRYLPFEWLESRPDIRKWEWLGPDPNFQHQRGRGILAIWQGKTGVSVDKPVDIPRRIAIIGGIETANRRMEMREGQIVTVRGEQVRIIALDSDETVLAWGCALSDPDRSVWFYRNEVAA